MDERTQLRRTQFKIGLSRQESAQEKRRREALAIQRAQRSNTLDSIRGIEDLSDLFLAEDSDSNKSEGRYEDAEEEEEGFTKHSQTGEPSKKISKPNKYRKFRDRTMRAEFLDLSHGLPAHFERDWILVGPVPKGKRCLALTLNHQNRSTLRGKISTILLSRKNADQIGEFITNLPPNSILDCIFDLHNQTLWILDLLQWKDQAMVDCEASFRFWWRDAKMSELGPQPSTSPTTLTCLTIVTSANFSKTQVWELAEKMSRWPTTTVEVSSRSTNPATATPGRLNSSYESDGLLFYLKSATYQSGQSLLAGWVPLQVLEEQSNRYGIPKLKWLCENAQKNEEEEDSEMVQS